MTKHGMLQAIWIKRSHGGQMDPVDQATLDTVGGIVTNADYGSERQVTLVEREIWDRIRETLDDSIHPAMRRANLLVSGTLLANTTDRIIRIGDCRICIRGETKPCHRMDEAHQGLKAALVPNWGAGAWGVVLDGGEIRVGDHVSWE